MLLQHPQDAAAIFNSLQDKELGKNVTLVLIFLFSVFKAQWLSVACTVQLLLALIGVIQWESEPSVTQAGVMDSDNNIRSFLFGHLWQGFVPSAYNEL